MSSAKPAAELAARRRLAERLRALRLDAGLSTTQLAHRLGWSQAKVSRIETATHSVAPLRMGDHRGGTVVATRVVADSLGAIRLNDPDDIAWQIEVFTRMQRAALDPEASRAVLEGLAARFATRYGLAQPRPGPAVRDRQSAATR